MVRNVTAEAAACRDPTRIQKIIVSLVYYDGICGITLRSCRPGVKHQTVYFFFFLSLSTHGSTADLKPCKNVSF